MLIKMFINKIYYTLIIVFIMIVSLSFNFINKKNNNIIETEYVSNLNITHVYLLNNDNYLVKVDYLLRRNNTIENVKDILNELSITNKKYNNLKGLIPSNTKINDIKLNNKIITIDFSSDLLKVNKVLEEKVIESIVYSLIELKDIDNVIITIDNKPLTKLEKNNKNIPILLNESIGINKTYDINNIKDIEKVIVYYQYDDYYVPVTKYINSHDNKVKIIIDSLKGNYFYNTNLRSYLSKKDIIDYKLDKDILTITFNSLNEDNLEIITYSLANSVFESIDVNQVVFELNSNIIDIKKRN